MNHDLTSGRSRRPPENVRCLSSLIASGGGKQQSVKCISIVDNSLCIVAVAVGKVMLECTCFLCKRNSSEGDVYVVLAL